MRRKLDVVIRHLKVCASRCATEAATEAATAATEAAAMTLALACVTIATTSVSHSPNLEFYKNSTGSSGAVSSSSVKSNR